MITTRLNVLLEAYQIACEQVGDANRGKALLGICFRRCHKLRQIIWKEIEKVENWLAKVRRYRRLIRLKHFRFPNRLQVLRAAHRLAQQRYRNMGTHQTLERIDLVKVGIQPGVKVLRAKHQRDALIVDMTETRVRRQCDGGKGQNLVVTVPVALPQARHGDRLTLRVNIVDLPIPPFVKRRHGHDTTLLRVHPLPQRAGRQPVRARVERLELGVRSVAGTGRVRLDQKGPQPLHQLPTVASVQDELGLTPRRYVQARPRVQRHAQFFHKPLHQGVITNVEPPAHDEFLLFEEKMRRAISIAFGIPGEYL